MQSPALGRKNDVDDLLVPIGMFCRNSMYSSKTSKLEGRNNFKATSLKHIDPTETSCKAVLESREHTAWRVIYTKLSRSRKMTYIDNRIHIFVGN